MKELQAVLTYLQELNEISITLRIILAVFCGGIIGLERGRAHQPAGMRTHMLVCLGAAIVMSTGHYMYDSFQTGDPARLGAQVISGIGFMGAGSIITSGKTKVRGLTTAAGLWTSACIGLAIGIGFYSAGLLATFAVYLIMARFKRLEYRFMMDQIYYGLYLEFDVSSTLSDIAQHITGFGLEIEEIQMGKRTPTFQKALITLKSTPKFKRDNILKQMEEIQSVRFAKFIF